MLSDAIRSSAQRVADRLNNSPVPEISGVDGSDLLFDVWDFCKSYIAYPSEEASVAHALWIAHAWHMPAWQTTPRLAFLSAEPGSGKSRALEVTAELVPDPIHLSNVTTSYALRRISGSEATPTLLIDEADTIFTKSGGGNESLRGLLNAGYRKGAVIGKATTKSVEELHSYAAVAIAGIGKLPDTVMTRSVIIHMTKRDDAVQLRPWRLREVSPLAQKIRARLETWNPPLYYPELPEAITDRNADVWEPLITIADAAGGQWPDAARKVAVRMVSR